MVNDEVVGGKEKKAGPAVPNEKLLQEKYFEFQMVERQIKQVQSQIEQLESQINELIYLQTGLNELKGVKAGNELFVPLGAGIFVNASLKDPDEVLVNVGGGVVVKKPVAGAVEIIQGQISELRGASEERSGKLSELSAVAGRLEDELSGLLGSGE